MKKSYTLQFCLLTAMTLIATACASPATTSSVPSGNRPATTDPVAGQNTQYDLSKQYVAFLVVNTPVGKSTLDGAKQRAAEESYEIGPVAYYNPGTTNFELLASKLTASGQVKLVWIIGSASDISGIKSALTKVSYQGACRFAVILKGQPSKNAWLSA
jgi:hypothetical protein